MMMTTTMRIGLWAMWLIAICHLLVVECADAEKNFTVITPQVDMALRQAPDGLWDAFAGLGIAFGVVFAFVGSKMLRTAGFFFGACAGALAAAVVLAAIGNVQSQIWLPVVCTLAVIGGIITSCFVSLIRFAAVLVLGVSVGGVFVQYGLSYIDNLPAWAVWIVIGFCVLFCGYFAYRSFQFMMIFASSFLGGFVVLLSVARLTRGHISLAGGGVCFLGMLYQLWRFRGKPLVIKKVDKKTKRELAAAERARKQEKERFEERVREIRMLADAEISQATSVSRAAMDSAQREREALLQQTRALEEERERLRQARQQVEQAARVVEAEYVHYTGTVSDLPVATPASPLRRSNTRSLTERPDRPQRPSSRPPPPTPDGWGGGARPWNKCPDHEVPYDACGCTNPRSKEQVLAELERLRRERERFEHEHSELERRNEELRERLKHAEATARQVAQRAALERKKATEEVLKKTEVEEKLNHERATLERLLKEAEEERQRVSQQLGALQKARKADQQSNAKGRVVAATAPLESAGAASNEAAVLDGEIGDDENQVAALDEEELRLKDRVAQAEGLEVSLRAEMELLERQPIRVFTEPDLGQMLEKETEEKLQRQASNVKSAPASPPILRKLSLNILPAVPLRLGASSAATQSGNVAPSTPTASPQSDRQSSGSKFASKWSTVERTYGVAGSSNVQEVPINKSGDDEAEQEEGELKPVSDLMSDVMTLLGKVLQFTLEAIVFVIAKTGWAIGKCLDAARDAHMEHQEKQLRRASSSGRSQFKASHVKDRFSSPAKKEQMA